MKNLLNVASIGFLFLSSVFYSCEKTVPPTVITTEVTDITGTTATCGGTITNVGSGEIICKGVCWSTITTTPTIEHDNNTCDASGIRIFISHLSDLSGGTTYYIRAYANNMGEGYTGSIGYGSTISFTTEGQAPIVETYPASHIARTSATLNGSVKANSLSTTVNFEYGTTESYGETVTATQSPVTGYNFIEVSADIAALTKGSIYHVRVKAENTLGTNYGNDFTFTSLP